MAYCADNLTGFYPLLQSRKLTTGYIRKIKKVLECVCRFCSKLKVDETNQRFIQARKIKDKKRAFHEVWELCKVKTICQGLDAEHVAAMQHVGDPVPHDHGGCNMRQPLYRQDCMKLNAVFKATKDEVFIII